MPAYLCTRPYPMVRYKPKGLKNSETCVILYGNYACIISGRVRRHTFLLNGNEILM